MCPGGVLSNPVPQPTHQVRQASAAAPFTTYGVLHRHRTALLRQTGRQDAHRNTHQVKLNEFGLCVCKHTEMHTHTHKLVHTHAYPVIT